MTEFPEYLAVAGGNDSAVRREFSCIGGNGFLAWNGVEMRGGCRIFRPQNAR
jgi:hypothetical protein